MVGVCQGPRNILIEPPEKMGQRISDLPQRWRSLERIWFPRAWEQPSPQFDHSAEDRRGRLVGVRMLALELLVRAWCPSSPSPWGGIETQPGALATSQPYAP